MCPQMICRLSQQIREGKATMEKEFLLKHWSKVRLGLMSLIDAFPEDKLGFIPVAGGWTAGRIMLHISSAANFWLHSGILSSINVYEAGKSTLEYYPTIKDIKSFLMEEHQRTLDLLQNFDPADWQTPFRYPDGHDYQPSWIFWHVLEHEIHHRGELSLIMGLLGHQGLDV